MAAGRYLTWPKSRAKSRYYFSTRTYTAKWHRFFVCLFSSLRLRPPTHPTPLPLVLVTTDIASCFYQNTRVEPFFSFFFHFLHAPAFLPVRPSDRSMNRPQLIVPTHFLSLSLRTVSCVSQTFQSEAAVPAFPLSNGPGVE